MLLEWDKYSIIEMEKGRYQRPLTDASNLISAGLGNRIIPLFPSPCLQSNGGSTMYSNPEKIKQVILSKIVIDDNGCWVWQGRLNENGYAKIDVGPVKNKRAHRISYEVFVGEIPYGLSIDHKCRNRACVNPDPEHLEAVTHQENVRRRDLYRIEPTTCKNGHSYSEVGFRIVNRYKEGRTNRRCSACARLVEERHRRKAG